MCRYCDYLEASHGELEPDEQATTLRLIQAAHQQDEEELGD